MVKSGTNTVDSPQTFKTTAKFCFMPRKTMVCSIFALIFVSLKHKVN